MFMFYKYAQVLGIPDRNVTATLPTFDTPQKWDFVIQRHQALRAGDHFDLRLGDPNTGNGHSWALRNLPGPGEKTLAVEQPTHTIDYFSFQGTIGPGYGAGEVSTHVSDKAEVIHSEDNKITFYLYNGPTPTKYTLMRMDGVNWLLMNHSITKPLLQMWENHPRPTYKELKSTSEILPTDFVTPKIDGANSLTILMPEKKPVVFGRRVSKKTGLPIEYTPKIPTLMNFRVPKEFGTTVLRTEVFGLDKNNNEIPNATLGGLLNSNVWKSRETQSATGVPLRLAAFDVVKFKGKDVTHLPIEDRYKIIDEIAKKVPAIYNPIELAQKTNFNEGFVAWRDGTPYKLKHKKDFDVYVKDVYPNIRGNRAGGFEYSLTPDGRTVGRVGTGFTHEELRNMLEDPSSYTGRVAKVYSQNQLLSGALRAPSFNSWHLDK